MHRSKRNASLILSSALAGAVFWGNSATSYAQEEPPAPAPEETPKEEEAPAPEEAPSESTGPSADDMAKARDHFMKGKELFDAKDFEAAVDQFKESYKLSKNSVLLYNIGFTHDEIGDKQMAKFYYEKFLRDTKPGAANRDVAKKRLRALKKELGGSDEAETPTSTVTSFKHTVIDESPPNTPMDIVAVVPEGVPWRAVVHYRGAGSVKFTAVEMRYRFKELVARIPQSATLGENVQYYIEVTDGSGKVLERSGEPTSPHIVYMEEGAKPRYYSDAAPVAGNSAQTGAGADFGGSGSGGSGSSDVRSSKFDTIKLATTIGAGSLVILGAGSYLLSSSYNGQLEDESVDSRTGQCLAGTPCKQFAQKQKDLQTLGKRWETVGTVAMTLGAATAVAAGVFWYLDITSDKGEESSVTTIPVVGNDYVGASAALRF